MATTTKPPTRCPTCGQRLHWLDPQPPAVYCGLCLPCNREYFGTAGGLTGSRVRRLSAAEHAAEQERDEEANRWD